MPDDTPSAATPPAVPPTEFPPAVVAIRPVGGLASRLKCIASFAVLAGHFGVPLHVCWGPSPSFEDVAWSTLFDADAPLPFAVEWLDAAQWQALRATKGVLKLEAFVSYLLTDYKHPFTDLKPIFQTRRPQRLTAECNRELSSVYSGVLNGVVPGFTAKLREYWGAFVPALGVREVVAAEVGGWTAAGATDVLGVHVRRNDALQSRLGRRYTKPMDAEVVALIAAQLAKNAREGGGDNTADVDGNAAGDAAGDAPATHHAFVATDDPGAAAAVTAAYGEDPRVHLYPWRRYPQKHGAPVAGQAKAVGPHTLRCCDRRGHRLQRIHPDGPADGAAGPRDGGHGVRLAVGAHARTGGGRVGRRARATARRRGARGTRAGACGSGAEGGGGSGRGNGRHGGAADGADADRGEGCSVH